MPPCSSIQSLLQVRRAVPRAGRLLPGAEGRGAAGELSCWVACAAGPCQMVEAAAPYQQGCLAVAAPPAPRTESDPTTLICALAGPHRCDERGLPGCLRCGGGGGCAAVPGDSLAVEPGFCCLNRGTFQLRASARLPAAACWPHATHVMAFPSRFASACMAFTPACLPAWPLCPVG